MANLSSTLISNITATPTVINSPNSGASGEVNNTYAAIAVGTSEDTGNVLRFVRVPSNCRVSSIQLFSDALGGTTAADIGLYQTAENGGAVVDADHFGSAVSLVNKVGGTEQAFESGVNTVADIGLPLWSALGLTADPQREYDVAMTLTADVTTPGSIGLKVEFVR